MEEALDHAPRGEQPYARFLRHRARVRTALQRLADERARERGGRGIRLARAYDHRRQSECPAVDESLAAVVVDQQLDRRLLRSVRGLGREDRRILDDLRHVAAVGGHAAGEDEPRAGAAGPDGVEQPHRAVEIDPHPEIEVLLGFAADHRGEVEHHPGIGVDQGLRGPGFTEIPESQVDARIVRQRRDARSDVAHDNAFDRMLGTVGAADHTALEQCRDEAAAEKPSAAGHQNLHFRFSRAWSAPTAIRPASRAIRQSRRS